MRQRTVWVGMLVLAMGAGAWCERSVPAEVMRRVAERGENTWRKAEEPDERLTSRELYTYALALAEAGVHPERMGRLFELGAAMQDRNPESGSYGNFRWYWNEEEIRDFNAVEFCMMGAALLWMRHGEALEEEARATLRETLDFAVEGCLLHGVSSSYTNIAVMNALNLILLGELLEKPEVADEGYERLDAFCLYTWRAGIHEYCSPTYYGVDLECLLLLEAFCERAEGQRQARALLELLCTDTAVNWHGGANRIGGPCSRDYDYVHGRGYLNRVLSSMGASWVAEDDSLPQLFPSFGRWRIPEALGELNQERVPRLVRQSWGIGLGDSRTYWVCEDVGLGVSGANYGAMDLPMTVDLVRGEKYPRCYFIPDGRHDPYGKKKIVARAHKKAQHLRPLWLGAQRRWDGLGLVLYRGDDLACETLESHFVIPREVDGLWVGGEPVDTRAEEAYSFGLKPGEALVVRQGTAAVGVRVPWALTVSGEVAGAALVFDGNKHGVVRLTVDHKPGGNGGGGAVGAAFWVRVGSGLGSDEAFEAWRRGYEAAACKVVEEHGGPRVEVSGSDGLVAVESSPEQGVVDYEPKPSRAVLEVDGKDVGRGLLEGLAYVAAYEKQKGSAAMSTALGGEKGVYLEAESGALLPGFEVGKDEKASGGGYVWEPGEPDGFGGGSGSVAWRLEVMKAGDYYVWGRVLAPTSNDDSFYLQVVSERAAPSASATWHTGRCSEWTWKPVCLESSREPAPFRLPEGLTDIELVCRENGTKIDKVFITPLAADRPEVVEESHE